MRLKPSEASDAEDYEGAKSLEPGRPAAVRSSCRSRLLLTDDGNVLRLGYRGRLLCSILTARIFDGIHSGCQLRDTLLGPVSRTCLDMIPHVIARSASIRGSWTLRVPRQAQTAHMLEARRAKSEGYQGLPRTVLGGFPSPGHFPEDVPAISPKVTKSSKPPSQL